MSVNNNFSKTNEVYFDLNRMIRVGSKKEMECRGIEPTTVTEGSGDLHLVEIDGGFGSGAFLRFKDENGNEYPMSLTEANNWLREHELVFKDCKWEYAKRGNVFTIRVLDDQDD